MEFATSNPLLDLTYAEASLKNLSSLEPKLPYLNLKP
jgi:hypothetical protein